MHHVRVEVRLAADDAAGVRGEPRIVDPLIAHLVPALQEMPAVPDGRDIGRVVGLERALLRAFVLKEIAHHQAAHEVRSRGGEVETDEAAAPHAVEVHLRETELVEGCAEHVGIGHDIDRVAEHAV